MRKKTLRRLSPTARRIAEIANEIASIRRRLLHIVLTVADLELPEPLRDWTDETPEPVTQLVTDRERSRATATYQTPKPRNRRKKL